SKVERGPSLMSNCVMAFRSPWPQRLDGTDDRLSARPVAIARTQTVADEGCGPKVVAAGRARMPQMHVNFPHRKAAARAKKGRKKAAMNRRTAPKIWTRDCGLARMETAPSGAWSLDFGRGESARLGS